MPNLTLPPTLHARVAAQAAQTTQSQEALVRQTLQQALATVPVTTLPALLADPRLAPILPGAPAVRLDATVSAALQQLADTLTDTLQQRIARGRVAQALLWHLLDPQPIAPPAPTPAPPPRETQTASIPLALNAALLALAGRRLVAREALIGALLDAGVAAVAAQPDLASTLAADPRVQPGDGRGTVTIHVPRRCDPALRQLARSQFGGVKSRALQALLWHGLDAASDEPAAAAPDRLVLLSGPIWTRLTQHLIELRAQEGRVVSIKAFVEAAVAAALDAAGAP